MFLQKLSSFGVFLSCEMLLELFHHHPQLFFMFSSCDKLLFVLCALHSASVSLKNTSPRESAHFITTRLLKKKKQEQKRKHTISGVKYTQTRALTHMCTGDTVNMTEIVQ